MPWDRRRQGETERPLIPAARRPSNPTTVAKAVTPPDKVSRTGRPVRGKKKRGRAAPGPLPASVTMSVARVLNGDATPERGAEGGGWGVLYRFVVRDADDRPIAPGSYTIRCHLLHLSSGGCFATQERGARISTVELDADSAAFDFFGIPAEEKPPATRSSAARGARKASTAADDAGDGEERLLEYFSFELQGVTYAIPRSGFVLARSLRRGRLEVVRTPHASASVHGAVVQGRVSDGGGDTYVLALRG